MRIKNSYLIIICLFWVSPIVAQTVSRSQVIMLEAEAEPDSPMLTLRWEADADADRYSLYRKTRQEAAFTDQPYQTFNNAEQTFRDSIGEGMAYDYLMTKTVNGAAVALGYVFGGVRYPAIELQGHALLVIEDRYEMPLQAELTQFEDDLWSEGWEVSRLVVSGSASAAEVKAEIQSRHTARPLEAIILIGHVPVPYSGNMLPPDGHTNNHRGAWPADAYYADFEGVWTDETVVTDGSAPREKNKNVVGDGKFDQNAIPGRVTAQIGRIDLSDMPAFGDEFALTRAYFRRNHLFRTGQTEVLRRGLVDDNFANLNLASTGWANFVAFFGSDSISTEDYFTEMKTGSYLWSYGCGAGSYKRCNGIGHSNDFAADSLRNIFTFLAGSYFGDWDNTDNFLRAPLAQHALTSAWGGIPKWYVHHMALGHTIGYGTRLTQNNVAEFFSGNFNLSANQIHIALMGDPTLKLLPMAMPQNVVATENADGDVEIRWDAAAGAQGYQVYRRDLSTGALTKRSSFLINATRFEDQTIPSAGEFVYYVRAVKEEKTASGSFLNISSGGKAAVEVVSGLANQPPAELHYWPNPANNVLNIQLTQATTYRIRLLSISGQEVAQKMARQGLIQIGLNGLTPGLYLLEVVSAEGGAWREQVIVNRLR